MANQILEMMEAQGYGRRNVVLGMLNLSSEGPVKHHLLFDIYMVRVGFLCGSAGKESACSAGDLGLIPGLGRSPGEGKGYPLQYSDLEKSMDCIINGVTKSWTQLFWGLGSLTMSLR